MEIKTQYEIGDKLYYMSRDAIKNLDVKGIDIRIRGTKEHPKIKIEYISSKMGEGHYEEVVAKSVKDLFDKIHLEEE